MLQELVKLLNMEQFELLYYRLLPVEGLTIYTQVTLVFEWFPHLNTVYQIVCDLEISRLYIFELWDLQNANVA